MVNNITPMVVAYPPGSGGVRLVRKFCNSRFWNQHPGEHAHYGWDTQGAVAWWVSSKYLMYSDDLAEISAPEPIVTSHCLYSPTLAKAFPGRKIIRIQANLYLSLRRWWAVYGRDYYASNHTDELIWSPHWNRNVEHCLHSILTHATYYTYQHDQACNELLKIAPGESEFADFMLSEFAKHADQEFDQHWQSVLDQDPKLAVIMTSDLV